MDSQGRLFFQNELGIRAKQDNTFAIAAKQGLIIIHSISPSTASRIRKISSEHFERDDFSYVINTHSHWDHTFGNQVFQDAKIIGHERCDSGMRLDELTNPGRIEMLKERFLQRRIAQLETLDPNSAKAKEMAAFISFIKRIINDYESKFTLSPPTITFTDRMILFMGDLTIHLYSLGSANSNGDIFIQNTLSSTTY